jgi:hypothetical protein
MREKSLAARVPRALHDEGRTMKTPTECPYCEMTERSKHYHNMPHEWRRRLHRIEQTKDKEGRERWICRSCDLYVDELELKGKIQ